MVTLRYAEEGDEAPPDVEEEEYCRAHGIRYHRIRPRRWSSPDGVPAETMVREFLEVATDPANQPVLVHCFAGMHRTGSCVAVFRMAHCGWSPEEAMREMYQCGYTNLEREWDVSTYVREYRPGAEAD